MTDIQVRNARDRLIDLLGIGQTYPLADLPVPDERLTVAFNTAAKIAIESSQSDVLYQLRYKGEPVTRTAQGAKGAGTPIEAQGNGGTILLETYKIQDDVTFEIYARKPPSGRAVYLHQTATVKVGLDTALSARILGAEYLDPASQADTAARIIPYGAQVEVEIERSQEGVDYRLIALGGAGGSQTPAEVTLSAPDVRGNLHTIVLRTKPIFEDVDIRIRATKTFDPSERRPSQTALLDCVLPLRVRANMALPVALVPAPIVGFKQPATVKIANTQMSTTYQLYVRPVRDREFVRQPAPDAELISVGVSGAPDVRVRRPAGGIWAAPEGYTAWGSAQAGTGADLQLTTDVLAGDSLIIVRAEKIHRVAPDSLLDQTVVSTVQLEQAALALVQPDPASPLRLKVLLGAADQGGTIEVFDGQPGVFYFFRTSAETGNLALPAYFHQRDDRDAQFNKGLGQLVVGVDLVVARPQSTGGASPAALPPAAPLLESGPPPVDTNLSIHAVKAQTRVAVPLSLAVQIPSAPEVALEELTVDYGAQARVRIKASRAKEWYQLLLNGSPLADPVKGTGRDRLLDTSPVKQNTTFVLLISQPGDTLSVERRLELTVQVRPA